MHRLPPACHPLVLGLLLPACAAFADPELPVRLDDRSVRVEWADMQSGRYSTEVELAPGVLLIGDATQPAKPLAPYRRQPLASGSAYRFEVPAPGRYRLIVETGDSPSLRLLPIKEKPPAPALVACQPWNGEAVEVAVGEVFADGTLLRDGYSGQTARVENGRIRMTPAPGSDGLLLLERADSDAQPARRDWRNATVYFVITDRFANGDPSNDNSYGRQPDGQQEIGTFHGGDLEGLTARLDYIDALGVDTLWISAPYEQIHGWVGGGDKGDFRHYAYHGYYALDYTQLDANMGEEDDLRELIAQAHARGIRVLFDVVMNHPGYSTLADMQTFDFGGLRDGMAQYLPEQWTRWQPESFENLHAYHNLIDYQHPDWADWWGKEWVRAGIGDYDQPPSVVVDPVKGLLAFLPDFKTESEAHVGLPVFLQHKQPTRAVAREDYRVRDYLIEWLTFWVREFGVDGFRADTVRHVEPQAWAELRAAADKARAEWSAAHPDDPLAGQPFWMVGEVFGHGPEPSLYQDNGFDALINFAFQDEVALPASECLARAETSYQHYAGLLARNAGHNFMSYASSHDTALFSDKADDSLARQRGLAAALLLAPGAVQIFYGDESARPFGPSGSDPFQGTRSSMDWSRHETPEVAALIEHWQRIGQFRSRHPAIGAGEHRTLSKQPYAFTRVKGDDRLIVVQAGGDDAFNR
ncbi:alpha-amylase [Stutzerimonas urumqiensis]|uniref:alpha-amylase n=1 Tax=Stutzerimonas urumqiensis TaxID=638269 RepID=UPI003BA8C10A